MEDQKNSGLGIASFVISIVTGVMLITSLTVMGYLVQTSTSDQVDDSPMMLFAVLSIFLGFGFSVLGIGLGIAGLFQKGRAKTFAILGTFFSMLILSGLILMIIFAEE